jgi:o-succinylbenzoate---CoA ligase
LARGAKCPLNPKSKIQIALSFIVQHFPVEHLLTYLKQRCDRVALEERDRDWLVGFNSSQFYQHARKLARDLQQYPTPPTILLTEPDPFIFLSTFIAAIATHCSLFLGNPSWGEREWQQVFEIVQPDLILGSQTIRIGSSKSRFSKLSLDPPENLETKSSLPIQNSVMIPTGGTSGKIRFAIHSWETLTASIQGFCAYFDKKNINSFCVLPLYHVSGLMQFLRSFLTEGRFCILPYKDLKVGKRSNIKPEDFFISLVPTQLQFLLQDDPDWLARFDTVLLGGAPAWKDLLEMARTKKIRLAPTYGMTETASQIVTLKPEDFLQGNNSSGRVLPHANVTIHTPECRILSTDRVGIITLEAKSLCLGYYPNFWEMSVPYIADDLGYFDNRGYLHLVGRNGHKIITGGKNVFPAEVEAAILATQWVADVCVVGLPHETWGQAVTAIYVPRNPNVSANDLKMSLEAKISKFKQPKYWLEVPSLPRNGQGKVNYDRVKQMAMMELGIANYEP